MEFYLSTNSASVARYAWVGHSGAGQWTSWWAIQEGNEEGNDCLQPPNCEATYNPKQSNCEKGADHFLQYMWIFLLDGVMVQSLDPIFSSYLFLIACCFPFYLLVHVYVVHYIFYRHLLAHCLVTSFSHMYHQFSISFHEHLSSKAALFTCLIFSLVIFLPWHSMMFHGPCAL